MQMDRAAVFTSTTLPQAQPTVQVRANTNMNIPQSSRESERPLQRKTNRSFEDPVPLSSFLITRILHWAHLQVRLSYVTFSGA